MALPNTTDIILVLDKENCLFVILFIVQSNVLVCGIIDCFRTKYPREMQRGTTTHKTHKTIALQSLKH